MGGIAGVESRPRAAAAQNSRRPDRSASRRADDPWAEQHEVDLARAAERPSFFGLSRPPAVEIPDVDTSPTMKRNVMVEELRRMAPADAS